MVEIPAAKLDHRFDARVLHTLLPLRLNWVPEAEYWLFAATDHRHRVFGSQVVQIQIVNGRSHSNEEDRERRKRERKVGKERGTQLESNERAAPLFFLLLFFLRARAKRPGANPEKKEKSL